MTRIIHRSKIYAREYYLSALIFGIILGWGESIVLWFLLPYNIETIELIRLNFASGILGGITALLCSILAIWVYKIWKRKEKFDRDIHQTSWVFSFTFALFFLFMSIGGLFKIKTIFGIIAALPFAVIIFVLIYSFSKNVLFKHSRAIRFSVEFVFIFFLLLYLLKHPGFRREIPSTPPSRPHIFIFDIDNLPVSESNQPLASILPQTISESLYAFPLSYASDLTNRYNYRDITQVQTPDSTFELTKLLSNFNYHQALFSPSIPPPELNTKQFSFRDVQNSALESRLSLVGFYDLIIPFMDLKETINHSEGYALNRQRDPILLSNRVIRFLSRKRDGLPFFILLKYPELSTGNGNNNSSADIGFRNLFTYMLKNDFHNNALFVFTSITGTTLRRPVYIFTGGIPVTMETPDKTHSQRDIPLFAASLSMKKEISSEKSRTFADIQTMSENSYFPVYVYNNLVNKNPVAAAVGPYLFDKSGQEPKLTKVDYPFGSEVPVEDDDKMLAMMKNILENPIFDGNIILPSGE